MNLTKYLLAAVLFFNSQTMMSQIRKNENVKLLALGDSYTICESVNEDERWPVQLITELRNQQFFCDNPRIIATTGWRTDDLKRAILAQNPEKDFSLVSLLIGVNNQYQGKSIDQYSVEFEELLQMAISFAGGDYQHVFVVSIPDYGFTPFGKEKQEEISKQIDQFNMVNRKIAERYNVRYIYITDLTREGLIDPSLVASDGLHPSGKMYRLWVNRMIPELTR